ncbi:MAG: metallophosphoesterase [Archaeoglobales archaeon]|nr:metallophosphoesterase [Archaeoglobales archaeon]
MFKLTPEKALIAEELAVIADLHLGIENAMQNVGVAIPRMQIVDVIKRVNEIVNKYEIERLIIAGDLKHDFAGNLPYEWDDVRGFLDSIDVEISVIRGNHDNFLSKILSEYSIELKEYEQFGDYYIVHGHKDLGFENLIMGHEHPAVKFRHGGAIYSYPCFLIVDKTKFVLPAFSSLVSGSDVLQGEFLSPILKDAKKIEVYAVEDEVVYLGDLETLRKIL